MKHPAINLAVLFVLMLAPLTTFAEEPVLETVEPPVGFADEDTDLTLTGTGFTPESRIVLPTGGPAILGTYEETPGNFYSVAVAEGEWHMECGTVHRMAMIGASSTPSHGPLLFMDVEDPSNPTPCGSLEIPWGAGGMDRAGDLIYIASSTGLVVIDLSGDTPEVVSTNYMGAIHPYVAVEGDYAYVLTNSSLRVYDVSDPRSLRFVSYLPVRADKIGVSGRIAFAYDPDFHIIDISDPLHPTLATTLEKRVSAATAEDNILYVATWSWVLESGVSSWRCNIETYDVSEPTAPVLLGTVEVPGDLSSLEVAGDILYALSGDIGTTGHGGLLQLDVSDPADPRVVGTNGLPVFLGSRLDIVIRDRLAYLVGGIRAETGYNDRTGLLYVIDLTETHSPMPMARLSTAATALHVTKVDDVALVAMGNRGIQAIDISNPEEPLLAGVADDDFASIRMRFVETSGPYALGLRAVPGYQSLRVYDIGDPLQPVSRGWFPVGPIMEIPPWRFAVSGTHAYIANYNSTLGYLQAVDFNDPDDPHECDMLWFCGSYQIGAVAMAGDYAYLIARNGYLVIVHVPEPCWLNRVVRIIPIPAEVHDIAISGNRAYILVDDASSLWILDLTSPWSPSLVGQAEIRGGCTGRPGYPTILGGPPDVLLHVAEERAYVSCGREGMHVFNVSDPTSPYLESHIDTPGPEYAVAVDGDLAYMVGEDFRVMKLNPPFQDVMSPTDDTITLTVPAGLNPGPYDVLVENPGGETAVLHNGFRVCEGQTLDSALEPIPPRGSAHEPVSWRLTLEGDDVFFEPKVRHESVLMLPELPSNLETLFERGAGSGQMAIELRLEPQMDSGEVVLIGKDVTALTALWQEMESNRACTMPRIDDHTYGDVVLGVFRTVEAGLEAGGEDIGSSQPPIRFRYEFSKEGDLTAALAWGSEVDLVLETVGKDRVRCEIVDTISFVETRRELCEEVPPEHSELARLCMD